MKKLLIVLLINTFLPPVGFADGEQAASRFVEYWNMGDGRSARNGVVFSQDFLNRRGPDGLARIMKMVYDDNGEIFIRRITGSTDEKIGFVASSQKGNWMEITLDIAEDSKISGLAVEIVPPPAEESEKGLNDEQIVTKLGRDLGERSADGKFSGSVLLARQGEILFAQAYGLADREKGLENKIDTPFNLGSMNKMFTGLAVAQLVEQGKLDYGDKVGRYLPGYPDEQVRENVTLHQLLTHTSGLGSYWNEAYMQRKDSLDSVGDFAALCAEEPLAFEPGSDYQYSNCGPVLLGLIIEAVSGQSYYDYIRDHIYVPAGMEHAGHFDKSETASGKAIGYFAPHHGDGAGLISNFDDLGNIGSPAGGGYASVTDLLKFAIALFDNTLIDGKALEELTTFKVRQGPDGGYAYLYADRRVNGRRYIGHNGGAPGINAEFSVFPDSGYTVIVLSNTSTDASPVADRIRQWVGYRKQELD